MLQPLGVEGRAVGQAPGAVVPARARLDFRQGREHRIIAAAERAGQRLARGGDQPVLLGLRDFEAVHLRLEVREQRSVRPVGERPAGEHPLRILAHRREVEGRRDDAEARLVTDVGGDLAHHPLDVAQPRHIGLRVLDVVDAVIVDQEDGDVPHRAAIVGGGKAVPAEAESGLVARDLILEQAEIEASRRAEPGGVEIGAQPRELARGERLLRLGISVGEIVEPVVKLLAAERGQELRVGRYRFVEGGVEKGDEALVFRAEPAAAGPPAARQRARRLLGDGDAGGGEKQGGEREAKVHEQIPVL